MIRFVVLFLSFVFLLACGTKKKQVTTAVHIPKKSEYFADSFIYRTLRSANQLDSSLLTLHFQYFKKISEPWQDSVNQQIGKICCEKMDFDQCRDQRFELNSAFFSKKMERLFEKAKKEYASAEYKALWEFNLSFEWSESSATISTLAIYNTSFFGKSSTLKTEEYVHFDKNTGRCLSLSDVVKVDKNYLKLVDSLFKIQNNLPPDANYKDLGFWFDKNEFTLSKEFYFKRDSLCFVYNPYDVAPLSYRDLRVSVPLKVMGAYLK